MIEMFQYDFILRAFEAGIIVGIIAPLIGIFLVLRRYSLIADTLSHVSLAGVAIGILLKINPLFTAIIAAVLSSAVIEKLRLSKKIYGESALAIFLSGSLAVAIAIISIAHGLKVDIFNYLFGSILTVEQAEVYIVGVLGIAIIILIIAFYKELVYISFDEDSAKVSGIPTGLINTILIVLAALTVAISIPIVGVLLIAALIVIPVVAALQFKTSFKKTIAIAECISFFSVVSGIIASYYLSSSPGATIVLITILFFLFAFFFKKG